MSPFPGCSYPTAQIARNSHEYRPLGLGNFIDRTLHDGGVVDFVSIGFSGLRTGIFNVADVAIIAGVVMVMWEQRKSPEHVETTALANPIQDGHDAGELAPTTPTAPITPSPKPPR